MKKISVTFFMICGLFSSVFSEAATIRLGQPKVELELSPGETVSGEIVAENPTNETLQARIYVEDWVYVPGGKGEKEFRPAGTESKSASRWITFTPTEDTLKPFGRSVVRYTLRVPESGVSGAHYSVLFFETIIGTTKDEQGVDIVVTGRIGALFYVRIKGTVEEKGQVMTADVKAPEGNKPLEIFTTFENSGNVDITVGGNFLVMDAEGKIAARGDVEKIYTAAGSTETGKTVWVGRLPRGTYQAVITYELGKAKELVVEERTLKVD